MLKSVYSPSKATPLSEFAAPKVGFHLVTLDVPRLDITDFTTGTTHSVGPGKSLALITFLARTPRRTTSRDVLCDLLWGDRGLIHSRPLLRQTLWLIKTQVNTELVHADGDSVRLSQKITSDAEAFVSAIERDDLTGAVALYSNDFFLGYAAPGAGRFEEWANSERVRLRALFLNSAEALSRRALNSGHSQDAIVLARRMRWADPNGQAGWRLQLEARIAAGDSIGAHADADQLEEWLRAEEWDPEPETRAAIRAARRISPPLGESAPSNDFVAELVGREKEFSIIHDAWLTTKSRGARFIHIVGESGLGKTRLTQDIVARIRASRGKVRYVRANFAERAIPFSFASAIAEALSSAPGAGGIAPSAAKTLVSLNPKLSSQYSVISGDTEKLESLRVGLALLELMTAVGDDNPIAIALDDLHWCDSHSYEALTVASSRLTDEGVFVLSSSRPRYSVGPLRQDSPILQLSRLTCSDVTALMTSLASLPETELAETIPKALCDSTEGIPLRLLESIRFCVDAGFLIRTNEQWGCPDADALFGALGASATIERRLTSLSKPETEILSLIGLGGMPTPKSLIIAAAGHLASDAEQTVAGLELRGLVVTEGDSWAPAHDSVAEAFVASADPETIRASHSQLGSAMAASDDTTWKRRAIPHLVEAGRWNDIAVLAAPILRNGRASSSEMRVSIGSLVGSAPDSDAVSRILAELPFLVRNPGIVRRSTLIGAPLIVLLGAFALTVLWNSPADTSPVLAMLTRTPDGNTEIKETRLDINKWDPGSAMRFESTKRVTGWFGDEMIHATPRPGTESWAIYSVYPDSGEGEIDLIDITGKKTRLTNSRHDDRPMSFSPDGERLLFMTTRWSSNGWADIGTIDIATGRVRRISSGNANFYLPSWSPDGTRIAFNGPRGLCIADADGSHTTCPEIAGGISGGCLGWVDDHEVLIAVNEEAAKAGRLIYDVDRGSVTASGYPLRLRFSFDPTASWAILSAENDDLSGNRISPAKRFDLARTFPQDPTVPTRLVFMMPSLAGSFLDSVAIARPSQSLTPGVPYLLNALGFSRDRNPVAPRVARWRSLTPEIASVDSLGVLVGKKPGFAVVELSAGGWRKTLETLEIRSATTKLLLDEKWDSGVNARWRVFGEPDPIIVRDGGANAFFNNGDGDFFSGAYSRHTFDARRGISMDFDVSTPINRTQWQLIIAGLQPIENASRIDTWDHKTGYITGRIGEEPACWFTYPIGEGKDRTTQPPWYQSMISAMGNPSFRIDEGAWYRVRVQIFPDGRCGTAINGRALIINRDIRPLDIPVLSVIEGMSVDTKILVKRVMISSGVPTDIDWTGLTYDGISWLRQAPTVIH